MAKKTAAMQKIEDHEKLCRLMQKQTFDRIKALEEKMARIEKWLIGGLFSILLAVLSNHIG
jgi:hypothetical protein